MSKYIALLIDTINHDETISQLLVPVTRIKKLMEKHKQELKEQVSMFEGEKH